MHAIFDKNDNVHYNITLIMLEECLKTFLFHFPKGCN